MALITVRNMARHGVWVDGHGILPAGEAMEASGDHPDVAELLAQGVLEKAPPRSKARKGEEDD